MPDRASRPSWLAAVLAGCALWAAAPPAALAQDLQSLRAMSIDQLAALDVTSVAKRSEPLGDAPAAIYVITHKAIARSGATNLPDMLRLAPNLQVAVIDANAWAITARGFNGNAADKLLVLIDGRSVYTPLFGGVLWDAQDVLPQDIERIEVVSGPGATLWGANAVNGVINIITRTAAQTPGGFVELDGGNRGGRASLQYGAAIAPDLSYRAYGEAFTIAGLKTSTGAPGYDAWSKAQVGGRLDWTPGADTVTLEGDLYRGSEQQMSAAHVAATGGDVELHWRRTLGDGGSLQVLSYFDQTRRMAAHGGGYTLDTYDLEFQHDFSLGSRQRIVWGAGYRVFWDWFRNAGSAIYLPSSSAEAVADLFVQDDFTLAPSLDLTAGMKLEKDPYAGVAALPTARLAWKVTPGVLLWAAASRAVRAPTLFDEDLQDTVVPGVLVLSGNRRFKPEKVSAYEVGARAQLGSSASVSMSAYYNVYDDLRSVEWVRMSPLPLLLQWGNLMQGRTYGAEAWGEVRPTPAWRLSAGLDLQHQDLSFRPGASSVNNLGEAGDDPGEQAWLRSSLDLGRTVIWTAALRWVGALPHPVIPAYAELDTNLVWAVGKGVQLSLAGSNLLHAQHLEYEEAGAPFGYEVPRSVRVGATLRF